MRVEIRPAKRHGHSRTIFDGELAAENLAADVDGMIISTPSHCTVSRATTTTLATTTISSSQLAKSSTSRDASQPVDPFRISAIDEGGAPSSIRKWWNSVAYAFWRYCVPTNHVL